MTSNVEAEAEAFRKWFASQTTYSSVYAMERALNITKDCLTKIKNGSRRAKDPELRRKLRSYWSRSIWSNSERAENDNRIYAS